MTTHFEIPAHEMLLDRPEPCPVLPMLTFVGIAVDEDDHQYVIIDFSGTRFYAGPDSATVHRRAEIFSSALRNGASHVDPDIAEAAGWWITQCWDALVDELVDQLTPALDHI